MESPKSQPHHPPVTPPLSGTRFYSILFAAVLAVAAAIGLGFVPKMAREKRAIEDTRDLAIQRVRTVQPAPPPETAPLLLSGELKPATEASILARVSGYVRSWKADLGDRVETGQVLAELDTPELERELARANAQLALAKAAQALTETSARRWRDLLQSRSASVQEADEKEADLQLKTASAAAAAAEVQRLQQIASFATITAPFAGTVTARKVDLGQLVEAGGSKELFRLADTTRLRVFVRVPQSHAASVSAGQTAELRVPEMREHIFKARVIRTAGAIEAASRTLLTELEVDNSGGALMAGSYAQVSLPEAREVKPLTVPANALIFRSEGAQLATVDAEGTIHFRKVTLGRDFGSAVEITTGADAADQVVLNPADALTDGLKVEVVR